MSNAATITRNSVWNLFDTILSFGAAFVSSVAVARVMGPTKLGYYQYVLFVATMTGTVASLGVPAATLKFVAEHLGKGDHATARAIIRVTFRFQAYIAAAVAIGGLIVVGLRVDPERRLWASLAVLCVVPQLLYAIPTSAITATEDMRPNVRASVISTTVHLVATSLTLIFSWDLVGLTASLLLSRLVDFGVRYIYYRRLYDAMPARNEPVPLTADVRQRLIRFSWQSTILLVLDLVVWNRSEIFFLQRYSAVTEIAFYSIGFNVVESLLIVPRVLSYATSTTMLVQQGRAPDTVGKLGVTTLRFMALFSLPAAFGLAALCDPSMRLVYGAKYIPAIPVLLVTALFSVGRALQMPAQRILVTTEKQGFLVTWGLTLAVVNVGTSLLFIPSMGAMGAAYSKGIVQTIAMIGLWVYARRRANTIVPLGQMIGLFAIAGAMFGLVRFLSITLPGSVLDLVIGIPVGIVVMIIGLRLIRYLNADDVRRLGPLERLMPRFAKAGFGRLIRFLVPEPRPDPTGLVGGVE